MELFLWSVWQKGSGFFGQAHMAEQMRSHSLLTVKGRDHFLPPSEAAESCWLTFASYGPRCESLNSLNCILLQFGFCWVSDLWQVRKRIRLDKGRDYLTALFDKWKKNWCWSKPGLAQDLSQLFAKELRCYFSPSSAQKYPRWQKT